MAGHSKWKQIKHKKAAADAKRGNLFSKMSREITVAAKTGRNNPDFNARLRTAIDRAKDAGMPKENIDRAVQKSTNSSASEELSEVLYEAMGPGGSVILIEGITDNKNRTLNELKKILANNGGKLSDQGSCLWNFEKIGIIELTDQGGNPDDLVERIINSGASDFKTVSGAWLVETSPQETEKVRRHLEKPGLEIKEVYQGYKCRNPIKLGVRDQENLDVLLEALGEQDDVQEIYTNIKE